MAITNLNIASDVHIKLALASLKANYNVNYSWINNTNIYLRDPVRQIRIDATAGSYNNSHIIEYIASSVFIHCYNAWSYLSTSLHAFLEGDIGNAIHNAYYAELRGIMSFLASQGIGVFNGKNILVEANGDIKIAACSSRESRTHAFAKLALEQWLNEPNNGEKVLRTISSQGISLKSWIDATGFPPGSVLPGKLASSWLADWSFDMAIVNDDHDLRNTVSYRPQKFDLSISRDFDDIKKRISFLKELWFVSAPNNLYNDSLLRFSLEFIYKQLGYSSIANLDINKDLKVLLQDVGMNPNTPSSSALIKFLRRETFGTDNNMFSRAKNRIPPPVSEFNIDPYGIIARACLLLQLTTRMADSLIKSSLTSKNELQFWLEHIGIRMGFWEFGSEPSQFSDLWADIIPEIDELERWSSNTSHIHNQFNFKKSMTAFTKYIKQIDRAYLWNLSI